MTNLRRSHRLSDEFSAEGRGLDGKHDCAANYSLCKEPFDYHAGASTTDGSTQLVSLRPSRGPLRPTGSPASFDHAHTLWNTVRGKRMPSPGLSGEAVPDRW